MKKTVTKEVSICDECEKEIDYLVPCIRCGSTMCYACRKKHGVEYQHGVHFSGSGDGFYCNTCDMNLTAFGDDKRHNAYLAIRALRAEEEAFHLDFTKRKDKAEALVNSLATTQ